MTPVRHPDSRSWSPNSCPAVRWKANCSIGPLDPAVAVDLVSDLAIGVAAAHHVGLHGLSLTPRSVLFTATGAPRLVGIGLAGYTARSAEPVATPLSPDGSEMTPAQPNTQATPANSSAGGSTPSAWLTCCTQH